MKSVRAKFKCVSVKHLEYGKEVELMAVMGDSPENKSFNDYTPSGNIKVMIAPEKEAGTYFEPSQEYYVDFTKAEK